MAMQITPSLADVPEACSTPESSAGDKQTDETPLYMEIHRGRAHPLARCTEIQRAKFDAKCGNTRQDACTKTELNYIEGLHIIVGKKRDLGIPDPMIFSGKIRKKKKKIGKYFFPKT